MNTRIKLAGLAIALATLLCSRATNSHAAVAFTAGLEISSPSDFYSPLTPYGTWETVVPYGRCWHPFDVAVGWRPYGTGYWEWTDCGWYWVSDEPWSWACYHYGSWVCDSSYGWVWVPATEWAPAWVVWRESPDYIGWAPCGPVGYVAPASLFLFVDVHHFHDPIRPGVFVVNNTTIFNRTRVINNITRTTRNFDGVSQRVVVNKGPDPSVIQRATGARFTERPIREVVSHTPAPAAVARTRSAPAYDRPVQPATREYPQVTPASPPAAPHNEVVPRREPVLPNAAQPAPPKHPTPPPAQERHDDHNRDRNN